MKELIERNFKRSVQRGAIRVLNYLLDQGADINIITAGDIINREEIVKPSREVLEILIANGWDVNNRRSHNNWPLLRCITSYPDLVEWCLAHGAKVDLPGDIPPLLEICAESSTVATFELLRAKGAPLGRRTLHLAVEYAAIYAPYDSPSDTPSDIDMALHNVLFKNRMDMVRHLVDVVGLDINAKEPYPGKFCNTPLCYMAHRNTNQDFRELIWFLLDRGADIICDGPIIRGLKVPSALEAAESSRNIRFLEAVEEWEARRHDNTKANQLP